MITLDDWQKEVLEAKGDLCICAGRQTGKSTVIAIKAAEFMISNPKKFVLIISTTEDQSQLLIMKILDYLLERDKKLIAKGKKRPTKHQVQLTNGSIVRCKAVGVGGVSIRGFTIDLLIADEAAFMPQDVWQAVTPMLLTTGGDLILISTPFGRSGFFFDCYYDASFKTFHVNSEEVMKNRPLSVSWNVKHRENALLRLERERERMTTKQYAQEYLGQFVEELSQFFPDELIRQAMIAERPQGINRHADYYLGVDVARMGDDESTFEVLQKQETLVVQVENLITTKTKLTETFRQIKSLNNLYNFRKIYIDDEGIGIGVFDMLLNDSKTKRKTEALRNSRKLVDYKNERKAKMMKQDLYFNLLRLMELRKIHLLRDDKIFQSLKSVQYEYTLDRNGNPFLKIFGNYTHIVEGLIRAAWCTKDKSLNMWVDYLKV